MSDALVHEAPLDVELDRVEETLLDAFHALQSATRQGRPAIVICRDEDLLGHGEVAAAAVAAGLVGLVRAFAMEGAGRPHH